MKKDKTYRKTNFKTIELMLTMLGSIVGVGFITGVEIQDFFARFGINFIFGLILFFILFFALVYKILPKKNIEQNEIKMQNLNGKLVKNTSLTKKSIKDFCLLFNLIMISSAMFSGLRLTLINLLKHNYLFIYIVCIVAVFILLVLGIKGLSKFNYLVIGILIFVIACVTSDIAGDFANFNFVSSFSFSKILLSLAFSFIYVFMNIVEVEPVVSEFGIHFSKKQGIVFSLIFSALLTALVAVVTVFLNKNVGLSLSAMPLYDFFDDRAIWQKILFCVGLIFALVSTMLTCLIGVKQRVIKKEKLSSVSGSFLAVLLCLIIGILPFSFFAKVIYPIIGVVNFFVFIFL